MASSGMLAIICHPCPRPRSCPGSLGSGPRPAQMSGAAAESGVRPPGPRSLPAGSMWPWVAPRSLLQPSSASAKRNQSWVKWHLESLIKSRTHAHKPWRSERSGLWCRPAAPAPGLCFSGDQRWHPVRSDAAEDPPISVSNRSPGENGPCRHRNEMLAAAVACDSLPGWFSWRCLPWWSFLTRLWGQGLVGCQ